MAKRLEAGTQRTYKERVSITTAVWLHVVLTSGPPQGMEKFIPERQYAALLNIKLPWRHET